MIGVNSINAMAMKKISTLLLCAAAALLFSACNKQESDVTPVSSGAIRFLAESIETRTAFGSPSSGKYPTLWTANDTKVKVAVNYASSKDATVNPSSDFKTAKFEATLSLPEAGPYTFMSMSPSSAFVAINAEHKSWNVAVPTAQTPLAGSVDEAAQILAAISSEYDEAPQTVKFQFKHVTAYGHFSIKNLNLSGASVQSVSLTSSVPFVGRWYYYPEDGTVEANSASSTITLETSSVSDIWFACAPADLSGATLKVTVATDKGSLEKTVSCPTSAKLSGGDVFKFSVDFDGISIKEPQKYILVTDAAELTPNSQVVIAHAGSQKALSTTQNGNNRGAAAVTISNNVITDPADDVQLFLLEEGSVDGSVAFKGINGTQADKYIYAASSSYNYLRSQDNLDANASWAVTIDEEGVTSIVAQGENTRNDIRYNGSNSVFSAYASTSSQEHVSIFKLEGSGGPATEKTPLSAPKNVKASLNADAANAIDVSWDAVSGVNYYEVTATPASGSAVTVQADEEAVTVTDLAYETVYTITVVAYPSDTQKYKKSDPAAAASTVKTGAAPAVTANTVAEVLAGGPGTYSLENVLVYAVKGNNAIVGDSTGKMLLFKSGHGFTAGDIFSVRDVVVTDYNGVLELTSGTYTTESTGNAVNHGTPVSLDDASAAASINQTFSAEGYHSAAFVSISGLQSGRYIENDNAKLYMNVADATNDGHEVVVTGYIYSYSSKYSNYNFQVVTIEPKADEHTLTVDVSTLTWEATDTGTKTVTVTTTNPASDGFTVSPASLEYFSYTVSGNTIKVSLKGTVTSNKTETLTLKHKENDSITQTVALVRKAAGVTSVTDVLNQEFTGIEGTTYTAFENKPGESGAIYAGNCAGSNASIQLRSNNNNSGIVTTASGGKVAKIVVTWNENTVDGRTLNVYGKTSAYSAATDLYATDTQGTLLGTVVFGKSTEIVVSGDYQYVGFRSASGAMYLTEVDIVWE